MAVEGWTWLYNAKKLHYFVDSRSLCGRWMYLGPDKDLKPAKDASMFIGDFCAGCKEKFDRIQVWKDKQAQR